ncbi:hypothetical protein [Pantoea sp. PSNIH1]|uniref:hypothetical protein n=1 Tax=Pantoea sp. PSNIH1 TaxID=1484158 RepID=UPI0011A0F747|nr:hypothetical protein [Pantoea sp. PSNIH1]
MAAEAEINFQLKIESGRSLVDMEYALETMSGVSGALTIITDSVLSNNHVDSKLSASDNVRSQLMNAWTGSYVQNFKIRVTDPIKVDRLKKLGNSVVSELIAYFIYESTYTEPGKLSQSAEKRLKNIEKIEDKIIDRIHERVKSMHKISKMKGYTVSLRRHVDKRSLKVFEINQTTSENIFNFTDDVNLFDIDAMVTRFNSFTGNGRILLEGENTTVPFGFIGPYSRVRTAVKRLASENLHNNNGVSDEARTSLRMTVKARRNSSGDVIKYMISNVVKP